MDASKYYREGTLWVGRGRIPERASATPPPPNYKFCYEFPLNPMMIETLYNNTIFSARRCILISKATQFLSRHKIWSSFSTINKIWSLLVNDCRAEASIKSTLTVLSVFLTKIIRDMSKNLQKNMAKNGQFLQFLLFDLKTPFHCKEFVFQILKISLTPNGLKLRLIPCVLLLCYFQTKK